MLQLLLLFRVWDLKREGAHMDKHLCAWLCGFVAVNMRVPGGTYVFA